MYTKGGKKQQRRNFETSAHHNLWWTKLKVCICKLQRRI